MTVRVLHMDGTVSKQNMSLFKQREDGIYTFENKFYVMIDYEIMSECQDLEQAIWLKEQL